jgi:hypothetical protein
MNDKAQHYRYIISNLACSWDRKNNFKLYKRDNARVYLGLRIIEVRPQREPSLEPPPAMVESLRDRLLNSQTPNAMKLASPVSPEVEQPVSRIVESLTVEFNFLRCARATIEFTATSIYNDTNGRASTRPKTPRISRIKIKYIP